MSRVRDHGESERRVGRRPPVAGGAGEKETSVELKASWSPASVGGQMCRLRMLVRN